MVRERIEVPPALIQRAVAEGWSLSDIAREMQRISGTMVSVSTVRSRVNEVGVVLHTQYKPAGVLGPRPLRAGKRHEVPTQGPMWTRGCLRCGQLVTIPRRRFLCDPCRKLNAMTG